MDKQSQGGSLAAPRAEPRAAVGTPSAMAAEMMAGLVQRLSSPTSWIVPPRAAVSCFQPSGSCSPRPSSMLQIGNRSAISA